MSYEQLNRINRTIERLPLNLKPAILGAVSAAQRNHAEITGRRRNAKFFYREAEGEDLRRGLILRTGELYFSFAFANHESRLLLDREFQSWSEAVDGGIVSARSIWSVREETDAMLNALTSSLVGGNGIEARFHLVRMRQNIDTMLRLCDAEMPAPAGVF